MRTMLLVVAALTAGCATQAGFERRMNGHLGFTETEMVVSMGPPNAAYTLPDGSKILRWTQSRQVVVPTMMQAPMTATTVGRVGSTPYSAQTIGTTLQQGPPIVGQSSCTVDFTLSPTGIATSWKAAGDMCRAD